MLEKILSLSSGNVPGKRLWFGFVGGAAAWTMAGALDVIWTGRGCPRSIACRMLPMPGWVEILLGGVTFALLAVAVAAGITSYRNWRHLANGSDFVEAEARGRKEFMAMFGVLVSVTLGMGIVWFILPIFIITLCVRAH